MKHAAFCLPLLALSLSAQRLPPKSVPGAIDPHITQANIKSTICVPNYTAKVRPPASYTDKLKIAQMRELGIKGKPSEFELDHRASLSVAGDPRSPKNLWLQRWKGPYNAHEKDAIEDRVHRAICSGKMTLKEGQAMFLGDWWSSYNRLAPKMGWPPIEQ